MRCGLGFVVVLAFGLLVGCANVQSAKTGVPLGSPLLASRISSGASITVPVGTTDLYFVRRGETGESVSSFHLPSPTVQLQTIEVAPFLAFYDSSAPADVYSSHR